MAQQNPLWHDAVWKTFLDDAGILQGFSVEWEIEQTVPAPGENTTGKTVHEVWNEESEKLFGQSPWPHVYYKYEQRVES